MAGLLDWITGAVKQQYAQGAPYREAVSGLLQGDPTKFGLLAQEFNRKAQTPEGALDVALNFAPLGVTKIVAPKTQYEIAQEVAQRNAALPVSEGGLGLPANNTAMDRAKAMGFEPEFHGRYSDYEQINPNKTFYTTKNPEYASIYTNPSASSIGGKTAKDFQDIKPNVMPVMLRKNEILDTRTPEGKNIFEKEFYGQYGNLTPLTEKKVPDWTDAEDFGEMFIDKSMPYKGIIIDEGKTYDINGNLIDRGLSTRVFDPSIVRSRFAAFDPFRRNEADILAGLLAVPATSLMQAEDKKKKRNTK